jgi:hypothetical protein
MREYHSANDRGACYNSSIQNYTTFRTARGLRSKLQVFVIQPIIRLRICLILTPEMIMCAQYGYSPLAGLATTEGKGASVGVGDERGRGVS